jgi:hypothetical protein
MRTGINVHLHPSTTATVGGNGDWITLRDGEDTLHEVVLFPHSTDATRALITALEATLK